MRPSAPPLRVFISGTNSDLYDYRTAVIAAVNKTGEQAVDMRDFPAQEIGAAAVSVAHAAQADVVVLLIGWRYGTVGPDQTRSYTHLEYDEATRLRKPILVFLAGEDAVGLTPPALLDPRLVALRDAVSHGTHVVDTFHAPDNLAALVVAALYTYYRKQHPPVPQRVIPRTVPPPVPDFVGREHELIQIDADLRRGQHTAVAAAVAGMGGVGKSALAAEVVNSLARDTQAFAGGITWARCNDLTGWEGVSAIYAQLLRDWGITLAPETLAGAASSQQEAAIRAEALRGQLALTEPALVLLDNVERDLPLREVLATLASLRITVLVTTRTFFSMPQLTLRRLDVLAPEEAHLLLRDRYVAKGGDWEESRDGVPALGVVTALGYLPLAIELAAARAARLNLGITRLDREVHEPDALAKLTDPTDPTAGVHYVLGRTLDLLAPTERACLAALGQVAATDYPQAVVLTLFAAIRDDDAAAQVLDLLITLSLVTPDEVAGIMRLRLHPLLHELAAQQWQAQQDETLQTAGLAGLLAGLNTFAREHKRNFVVLAKDEALYMEALRTAAKRGDQWQGIINLSWAIDDYLDLQGRWKFYDEMMQLQLQAYREMGDRAGEGWVLGNLGILARRQGRYAEAAEFYAQDLAIARELGDRASEGQTLGNLGVLVQSQGRYAEAAEFYEQRLAIARELGDRAGEGQTLGNLGILAKYQGRDAEAAKYYAQSLEIARKVGDLAEEGQALGNLGSLAFNQQQYTEAAKYFGQWLEIVRELGDRSGECYALDSLGSLASNQEKYVEAAEFYEQSLTIARELGDRAGERRVLSNFGMLAANRGQSGEAVEFYEQSLAIARELGDHAGEGHVLGNLGLLSDNQGRYAEAERFYEQSLAILAPIGEFSASIMQSNLERVRKLMAEPSTPPDDAEQPAARRWRWPWERQG